MIDLVDRFKKHELEITRHLNGEKEDYFGHDVYKKLAKRKERLKKSNDMDYNQHRFMSKTGFPIQRNVSRMRKFIFDQNYADLQLYNIKETNEVDTATARNIEDTLNDNLRRTNFSSLVFNYIKLDCADYGAAVVYSAPDVLLQPHFKTVTRFNEFGNVAGYERVPITEEDIIVQNHRTDILNYFQNPDVVVPEHSSYQGHIERWDTHEFISYTNQEGIQFYNIKPIIKDIDKQGRIDQFYTKDVEGNITKYPIDVTKIYSLINIKGNEDNTIPYYVEMVDGKVIRIEQNMFDENLRPYAVFNFIPRGDAWWGNTDGEMTLPHENVFNTLLGLKLDCALKAQDQSLFYKKGSIDAADWNQRKVNNGFVGIDFPDGMDIRKMVMPFQSVDQSIQTTDSAFREINSSLQSIASQPNVNQRVSKTGPLQNTTATAVNTMQEQGDIKEGSYTRQFNIGVIRMGKNNITLLQQVLPDDFAVSAGNQQKFLEKSEIIGAADIVVRTALTNNKAFEAGRLLNIINTIYNLKGTQQGGAMQINEMPVIKKWLEKSDLGDINELINEAKQDFPVSMGQAQPQQQVAQAA
jgi:hypothetical protein